MSTGEPEGMRLNELVILTSNPDPAMPLVIAVMIDGKITKRNVHAISAEDGTVTFYDFEATIQLALAELEKE